MQMMTTEQFLRARLRWTEIYLLRSLISNWILAAALIVTLAVIFDKLPG